MHIIREGSREREVGLRLSTPLVGLTHQHVGLWPSSPVDFIGTFCATLIDVLLPDPTKGSSLLDPTTDPLRLDPNTDPLRTDPAQALPDPFLWYLMASPPLPPASPELWEVRQIPWPLQSCADAQAAPPAVRCLRSSEMALRYIYREK